MARIEAEYTQDDPPQCPEGAQSSEDAHLKNMSTFETDEHLRAPDAVRSALNTLI